MILNTVITCFKKGSYNEVASLQNLYGWYLNIFILLLQFQSFIGSLSLLEAVPWGIADLNTEQVRGQFWQMRHFSVSFKEMVFGDSMTVCLCVIKLITLSRIINKPLNKVLNNVQLSAGILVAFLIVFAIKVLGFALFNLGINGNQDARYTTFMNALLYTIYYPSVLDKNQIIFNSVVPFIWHLLNTLFYYYLMVILLAGTFSAITASEHAFCEKSRSLPAVNSKGDYIEEEVPFGQRVRQARHDLLMYLIAWTP